MSFSKIKQMLKKALSIVTISALTSTAIITMPLTAHADSVITGAQAVVQNAQPILIDNGATLAFITSYEYDGSGTYIPYSNDDAYISISHKIDEFSSYGLTNSPTKIDENGLYNVDLDSDIYLGTYTIKVSVGGELLSTTEFEINTTAQTITDGAITMTTSEPIYTGDSISFETKYAYNAEGDCNTIECTPATATDQEMSIGVYKIPDVGFPTKYKTVTSANATGAGTYTVTLDTVEIFGGDFPAGTYAIIANKAENGTEIFPTQEIARSATFQIITPEIDITGTTHYIDDTLAFAVTNMPEGSTIKVSKYASSTKSSKVDMLATPAVTEDGSYLLPLTVTNNGESMTDFTPGYYVIDILSDEETIATKDFDVLSGFTDANVEIENETTLLLNKSLNFTTTYKLKGNTEFETTPQTAPTYEIVAGIYTQAGSAVSSLAELEVGSNDNYSLDENGNYSINLNSNFEPGNYRIILFTVLYDDTAEELSKKKTTILKDIPFTVKELTGATITPSVFDLIQLGDTYEFNVEYTLSNGNGTESATSLPEGTAEIVVYEGQDGLTPVTVPEGTTILTDNGDGSYELNTTAPVFETGSYTLAVQEVSDALVKPYDSKGFTVIEPLVTSITENLGANFSPTFDSKTISYTLAATNAESSLQLTVNTIDGVTLTINDIAQESGVASTQALAVGNNTFTIKASYADENENTTDSTYTIVVTRAEAATSGGYTGSTGGGGGGGGGSTTSNLGPKNTFIKLLEDTLNLEDNTVLLNLGASSNSIVQMQISLDKDFTNAEWIDFATQYTVHIDPEFEGTLRVYVKFKDGKGTSTVSSASIKIDRGNMDLELLSGEIAAPFTDIIGHWAEDAINSLRLKGIVKGRSDGIYEPNEYITRAELLKIAVELFEITLPTEVSETPFSDVETNEWYAKYVAAGKASEIVGGYEDGTFKPNANISRSEALKILLNASGIEVTGGTMDFKDTTPGTWYEKYVAFAQLKEIVMGYEDRTFRPLNPISRAEIAVIAVKIEGLE